MQSFHSMSMAFPLWPLLFLLLTPSIWAGPPSTDLTPPLQQLIPYCAQTCLEFFIAENFPSSTCGPPQNFDCLCSSDSTSGFTLGEGALECLYTSCDNANDSEALAVYDICMPLPNAKPNTHGTLTATVSSPTPSTSAASTSSNSQPLIYSSAIPKSSISSTLASVTSSSLRTRISISSSSTPSSSSSATHSFHSSLPTSQSVIPPAGGAIISTPSSTSTSAATSGTAAPASSPAPRLSKPQIAGVVVAGVGAAAIGLGLCVLVFCLRRRRDHDRRNSGSSFGGDKIIGSEETSPDMAAIAARDFEYEHPTESQSLPRQQPSPTRQLRLVTPASSSEDGWGHYQRNLAPEQTGLALEARPPRSLRDEHSPITPSTNRTRNSQLLPDKPTYSLFPPPPRLTPRNSIPNQVMRPPGQSPRPAVPPLGSPFARSLPQHPSNTSQVHLQGGKMMAQSNADPFIESSSRSPPGVYPRTEQSRTQPVPPPIRRESRRFRVPSWEQPPSAGVVRKPLPTYQAYRPLQEEAAPARNEGQSTTEAFHKRRPSRKKSSASRPMTVFSNGSETSFETIDNEDEEHLEPRSTLSPVAEVRSPPRGRISYPAIPVSAAESPTRRPQDDAMNPSAPDSLLSKRLGQAKAKEIADRLQGPSRKPNDGSAKWKILVSPGLKGIDSSGSPPSARYAVKSPPTPWRR